MSSTFQLANPNYKIQVIHDKKKNSKHNYTQETLSIFCYCPQGTYETVLDAEATFVYFDNIKGLYDYLRKNKRRNIATLDSRDCLNILVDSKEGLEGTEALPLVSSNRMNKDAEDKQEYEKFSLLKTKFINKLQKVIKNSVQEKVKQKKQVEAAKKDFGESLAIFQVNSPSEQHRTDYHIFASNPLYEFKMTFKKFLEQGIKIKLVKMTCEKIILGVAFVTPPEKVAVKHECQFSRSFMHSFPVEEGDILEVMMEDESDLVINNATKNNGKLFETSSNLGEESQCTIYVSLPQTKKQ